MQVYSQVLSAMGLLAAVVPLAAIPLSRQLYDVTLETYPSAYIHLAAALMLTAGLVNVYVYIKRKAVAKWEAEQEDNACDGDKNGTCLQEAKT
jgi:hypothetical protein